MHPANFVSLLSVIGYVAAYGLLTDHARRAAVDAFPFYCLVTLAASIHAMVVLLHTWHKK